MGPRRRLTRAAAIRRVLYGLHAVARLHLDKEEAFYFPVLDAWLTSDSAEHLFRELEAAAATARTDARGGRAAG